MVLNVKPVYLALFSLTLLAVIAGSGAVMALAGQGRDVMVFGIGAGTGMSLVSALSMEMWQLSRQRLAVMQREIMRAVASVQLGQVNPHWLLSHSHTANPSQEIHLEIECRRLLDRTRQLLEKAVDGHGKCHYCHMRNGHEAHCPVPAAQQLYEAGKAKRVPWQEYKKSLPEESF